MGVWWTMPTTFLSGAAAAGAMGLINSSGNMGGWVGPYMLGSVFDDGGEGGELVGTETCHKNILRSVKIFR